MRATSVRVSIPVAVLLLLSGASPAPREGDAAGRIADLRAEAMRAVPGPDALRRIPEAIGIADGAEAKGRPAEAGAALNVAAIYALLGGDLPLALATADRAARLCTAAGDLRCHGNAMNQSAIALWRQNDPYAAMQRLDRGARAFVAVGDTERAAIARLNSANIRYDIGDLPGALADYEAIDRSFGTDPRWDPVGMLNSKAEVLVKLGRLDEARLTAARAVAMLKERERSSGTRWESDVVNNTRAVLALVEASSGNADAALPLYRAYLAAADESGSPLERHNANYAFAEGLMILGRPAEAYPHIEAALALIDETDPAGRRDTYDLASRIASSVGRTTEALRLLRAAETVRRELGAATLRSAINDANAQMAVAEREAQLARRDAVWAAERSRLFGWIAFGIICFVLAGVTLLLRFRAAAIEQRFAAVLEERTRLARELHDTLLQGFTGITMQLRAASRSDPARIEPMLSAMADEAGRWVSETRHAVWDMRAATADGDLRTGLEQAIATARTQSEAELVLDYRVAAAPRPPVTAALLRIAQEALSNAARHAGARRIVVSAETVAGRARLEVRDDGIGFRAQPELSAMGGHWGLLGMRERIEALGGALAVDSAPGRGTRIVAEVPV